MIKTQHMLPNTSRDECVESTFAFLENWAKKLVLRSALSLGWYTAPPPFLETNRQIYCISAWQQNPSLSLRDVVAALFRLPCQRLESKSGERVRHSIATAMDMHVATVTVIALSHIVCHQLID